MTEEPGLDLLKGDPSSDILIVVTRGEEMRVLLAPAEKLQAVLDKAAREFRDPARPATPPIPEHLLSSSDSRLPSSPPTRTSGRGRRKPA